MSSSGMPSRSMPMLDDVYLFGCCTRRRKRTPLLTFE